MRLTARWASVSVAVLFVTAVVSLVVLPDPADRGERGTPRGGEPEVAEPATPSTTSTTGSAASSPSDGARPSATDPSRAGLAPASPRGGDNPNAALEEHFLKPPAADWTEVARGEAAQGKAKWRLYSQPEAGSFCLRLALFVYDPSPGMPFKSSTSGSCSYPDPIAATGNGAGDHGMVWFGPVVESATRVGGRAQSDGREVEASLFSLDRWSRKVFVVLLPNTAGRHEFVATDANGTEVGRTGYHYSGVYGPVEE